MIINLAGPDCFSSFKVKLTFLIKNQMNKNPELSIIIPQHNTQKLLLDCLDSIYRQTKTLKFEVIVVDNASLDNSVGAVRARFPLVKVINNKKNLGYARANNQGVGEAKGKYLLFLNSDTIILDKAIEKSLFFLKANKKFQVLGCRLLNQDKTLQPSVGFLPHIPQVLAMMLFLDDLPGLKNMVNSYQKTNSSFYRKKRQVDWVTGAFLLTEKQVLEKAGGFDEDFFMYAEEVEWFLRVKKNNFKTCFYPKAKIIHLKGKSSENGFEKAVLGEYKGLVKLYQKHKKPWQLQVLKSLLKLGAFLRVGLFGILKDEQKRQTYEKAFKLV